MSPEPQAPRHAPQPRRSSSMATSMTGFGAGVARCAGLDVRVELRSVNHRGLDVRMRLPPALADLQVELQADLRDRVRRGHIDVSADLRRAADVQPHVRVNVALGHAWQRAIRDLSDALAGGDDGAAPADSESAPLALILAQPGVVEVARPEDDSEAAVVAVRQAWESAVTSLIASRDAEGERLVGDLLERVATIDAARCVIAALADQVLAAARSRMRARVEDLVGAVTAIDRGRIETEIVLIADRSDITEELVRLGGHLVAFRQACGEDDGGRKLGFLVQELLRETNTIGSKCSDLAMTEQVVLIKVELEKIREQVLNLA